MSASLIQDSNDRVEKTISEVFTRFVFPHEGKISSLIAVLKIRNLHTPEHFQQEGPGCSIDISSDLLDSSLKRAINYFRGVEELR